MATTLETVAKTDFGSIAGNTGMYTGANVDSLLADLISKYDAKLSSAMHYKGSKANLAAIQAVTSPEVGDVYKPRTPARTTRGMELPGMNSLA